MSRLKTLTTQQGQHHIVNTVTHKNITMDLTSQFLQQHLAHITNK